MKECVFCHKEMAIIDHANKDLLDIYSCGDCKQPEHTTQYRHVCYKDEEPILATTIHVDEFYIILNYAFSFISRRTNYTTIYRKVIGAIDTNWDLEPVVEAANVKAFDMDIIVQLPYDDIEALKKKLQIYILFS